MRQLGGGPTSSHRTGHFSPNIQYIFRCSLVTFHTLPHSTSWHLSYWEQVIFAKNFTQNPLVTTSVKNQSLLHHEACVAFCCWNIMRIHLIECTYFCSQNSMIFHSGLGAIGHFKCDLMKNNIGNQYRSGYIFSDEKLFRNTNNFLSYYLQSL